MREASKLVQSPVILILDETEFLLEPLEMLVDADLHAMAGWTPLGEETNFNGLFRQGSFLTRASSIPERENDAYDPVTQRKEEHEEERRKEEMVIEVWKKRRGIPFLRWVLVTLRARWPRRRARASDRRVWGRRRTHWAASRVWSRRRRGPDREDPGATRGRRPCREGARRRETEK